MSETIPIHLAVEDELSEVVLRAILMQSGRDYAVGSCFRRHGFGHLKRGIGGFNNAAKGVPFLVLADLDSAECAPVLIRDCLRAPAHKNLLFRVAVREVEAWLLAHRTAFASFLGIRSDLLPPSPDDLANPKELLIGLARRSRRRRLREAIVPGMGSTAKIGPDYNAALSAFVESDWDVKEAQRRSPSLGRAAKAIAEFKPCLDRA